MGEEIREAEANPWNKQVSRININDTKFPGGQRWNSRHLKNGSGTPLVSITRIKCVLTSFQLCFNLVLARHNRTASRRSFIV